MFRDSRLSAYRLLRRLQLRLTSAELVYALAWAGEDHSFYEPAFLFSGTFTNNGATYVKRVLVPAVDPSQLAS